MLPPTIIACVAVVGLAALVLWWRAGRRRREIDRVLRSIGSRRCAEALAMMRRLADRGSTAEIVAIWDRVELPLIEAVPDCPPLIKGELIAALDACALACRHVETARRINTVRNSMVNHPVGVGE